MHDTRLGSGLGKIRARRRFSLEVVLIAVTLASLINIVTTCFLNALDPQCANPSFWWKSVGIFGLILLGTIGVTLLCLFFKKETEKSGLTLILPIYVDQRKGTVEILAHKKYAPAQYGHQLFSQVKKDVREPFLNAWPGTNSIKETNFGPGHFCWDTIVQLVQALVFLLLKKYGEETLTDAVHHKGEFRRLARHIISRKLDRTNWPSVLQSNVFLAGRGVKILDLPQNAKLLASNPEPLPSEKPGRRELTIRTRHCSLTFSLSPYWTILKEQKAAKAIAVFSPPDISKTCFLIIPIELLLVLKGTHFSSRSMNLQYQWFQKLIDNTRRRMSWGLYLRGQGGSSDDV